MTLPAGTGSSAAPSGGGRQIIQVPAGGGTRGRLVRTGGVALVAFIVLVWAINAVVHHENSYEKLADSVTAAVAANDMRPVEAEFNALRRPELENHARVGRLSDFVNELGAFQRTKEDTPANSPAGYHHFIAQFDKGTRSEEITLDADGKIARFQIHSVQ